MAESLETGSIEICLGDQFEFLIFRGIYVKIFVVLILRIN
jgi:hypothetical protein